MSIRATALLVAAVLATPAAAQSRYSAPLRSESSSEDWATNARFFTGVRAGVAIPPNAVGVAPNVAIEVGVSAPKGIGFGLHILGMANPPAIQALGIQKAEYGIGALADVRMYFQSVEPLTLYATLSAGFVAGPAATTTGGDATNVVLPLINPGFGARVKMTDTAYVAFEFGMAGFFIPFVTISAGWEPLRRAPRPVAEPVQYAPRASADQGSPPQPPPADDIR